MRAIQNHIRLRLRPLQPTRPAHRGDPCANRLGGYTHQRQRRDGGAGILDLMRPRQRAFNRNLLIRRQREPAAIRFDVKPSTRQADECFTATSRASARFSSTRSASGRCAENTAGEPALRMPAFSAAIDSMDEPRNAS